MIFEKNILITGATSGMGKAMAEYFHSQNANLILTARSKDKLQTMASEFGNNTLTYAIDFSKLDDIKALFDFAKEHYVKLDGIVHCAGTAASVPLKVNNIEQTEYIMRVNFEAFTEICKYASSKRYTNDGASIIAMSSTASISGDKGLSIYSASKAAINNYVKCAARELRTRGIRVNAIAPSMVETNMYYQTIQELPEMEYTVKANQTFGLIQPEYIAYLAEFLLSERAKYISGSIIVVGAGNIF